MDRDENLMPQGPHVKTCILGTAAGRASTGDVLVG